MSQRNFEILLTAKEKVQAAISKAQKALESAGSAASETSKKFLENKTVADALSVTFGIGLAQGVSTVKNYLNDAMESAMNFETALAKTNTVLRTSEDGLEALGDKIENLSTRLPISAQELADASFTIASAGVAAENVAGILEISAAVAVGAMTDTTTAFEGIIAVIKGYSLEITDAAMVADMFFKVNELGQTTVGEVATAIQKVATTASAANISIEETMGIFATFTGITGNANEVATQYKATILALSAPTAEASAKFKELGVEVGQSAIEEKGFAEIAKEVYDSVNGNQEALRKLIPSEQALALVVALGSEQFEIMKEKTDGVTNSSGALADAVTTMTSTTEGQLKIAENRVDKFSKAAGAKLLWLKSHAVALATGMWGMAESAVAGLWFLESSAEIAINAVVDFLSGFIDNMKITASNVWAIAKNIAHNIKAAFTGGEFVKLSSGLEQFVDDFTYTVDFAGERMDAVSDLWQKGLDDMNQEAADFALAEEVVTQETQDLADALNEASGEFDGLDSAAGGAEEKMTDLEKAIIEMEDAYTDFESVGTDAMENIQVATEEALSDLEDSIADVRSEMEELTASFLEQTSGGKADMAEAYVEQEEKVQDLKDALAELKAEEEPDGTKIAEAQAELDEELAALEAFGERAVELEEEIAEARRVAGLTDFEQTIEQLDAEQQAREDAFNEEMQQLADKLIALEEQKLKIQELSDSAIASLLELATTGGLIYDDFMTGLASKTEEDVNAMILKLEELSAAMSEIGGMDITDTEGVTTTSLLEGLGGGTNLSVGGITVQVSGTGTESPEDLAQLISDAVQKSLTETLENLNVGQ